MKILIWLALIAELFAATACIIETPTPAPSPTAELPQGIPATPTPAVVGNPTVTSSGQTAKQYDRVPDIAIDTLADFTATIRTSEGSFKVELFASEAPVTVNNFVFLSRDGFYNGLLFHRVIENFMIQAGDPTGTGAGGPGYQFQDEIVGGLVFDAPGKLAMANRPNVPGSNGSQFFITTVPTPHLTGAHTIFGQIVEGQDVVDSISRLSADSRNRPFRRVVIESIDIVSE